eukprot:6888950-Ditylum_brightwellii.AAC.1
MSEGLEAEIKLTLDKKCKDWEDLHDLNPEGSGLEPLSFKEWKQLTSDHAKKHIQIIVYFDMGWKQKGLCSLSGHALMVGTRSRKIIDCVVCAKECQKCQRSKRRKKEAKKHQYPKNYEGCSKDIEVHPVLLLTKLLYEKEANKKQDNGLLPLHAPEPEWLADPIHHIEAVAKIFFDLKSKGEKVLSIIKSNCLQMNK